MKVLILTQYFRPESFIINDLADLLSNQCPSVVVLTGKPNYPEGSLFPGYRALGVQRENYGNVEVVRVPLVPRGRSSRIRLFANYLSFLMAASIMGPIALRRHEFDVVLVYGTSPLLKGLAGVVVSKIRHVPLVVWVQDLWPESLSATGNVSNRMVLGLVRALVRWMYNRSDLILIQSQAFRASVASNCNTPGKIEYYPNLYRPPDGGEISPKAAELVATLKTGFAVVFAGNLGSAQDPETILETARLLAHKNDISIVLVGSGSRDKWLAEQAALLGLDNLLMPGRFDPVDMPHIFAAAAGLLVTLAPQPIFALTVPSKIQSYLAAGKPIAAALDGEPARIIAEAGAGYCAPAGDANGLAAAILRLYSLSGTEREDMGRRGRAYYERNFMPDRLTGDLIGHLRSAISARRKAE